MRLSNTITIIIGLLNMGIGSLYAITGKPFKETMTLGAVFIILGFVYSIYEEVRNK